MKRVGVFYATREGQARKVAERVTAVLITRDLEVALHDVRDAESAAALSASDATVLIASIHMGKHEPEMIAFVKEHLAELEAKPGTFISVCMAQAAAEDPTTPEAIRAKTQEIVRTQLRTFLDETRWHPAHVRAVAGALLYTHYNFLVRWVMKQISKSEARSTDTSRDHEYTDWVSLDHFADQIASELSSSET